MEEELHEAFSGIGKVVGNVIFWTIIAFIVVGIILYKQNERIKRLEGKV